MDIDKIDENIKKCQDDQLENIVKKILVKLKTPPELNGHQSKQYMTDYLKETIKLYNEIMAKYEVKQK